MLDLAVATPAPVAEVSPRFALSWDVETFSTVSVKKFGAIKYARDPSTGVWLFAYRSADGAKLWFPGDRVPDEFIEAAANPAWRIIAHNAGFEFAILHHVLRPKHGFPAIPIDRWRCTAAASRALGLPAKLGLLGSALSLVHRKDSAGERLMKMMAAPRKPRKGEPPGIYWRNTPTNIAKLGDYCVKDEESTFELSGRVAPLSDFEQQLWALDHKINSRGFCIDRAFAEAALKIARAIGPEINAEIAEVTNNEVDSINKVAALTKWLHSQGCAIRSLKRDDVEWCLEEGDISTPVRRALRLRLSGAQAAAKKIVALLDRAGDDDRVRGSFVYHAAATGRFSGEGPQPQNLKKAEEKDIEAARVAVATGDLAHVKALYEKPLAIIGDLVRSTIVAGPGQVLIGGDFSSIESRVLAWLTGEEWELNAYRRFDATKDPRDEPYCAVAAKIYGVPPGTFNKESPERAVGKICTLAFGYMGGLRAFRNFEPDKFTDAEVEEFKVAWRLAHPRVVKFWYAIDDACVAAVQTRRLVPCGLIRIKVVGSYLQIKLPSGRKISYPQPRLILDDWGRPRVVFKGNARGQFVDCRGGQGAYGGLWTENVVSGIARDLLVEAMLRVEAAGFPITMTVHDEIVAEIAEGADRTREFSHLLTRKPAWAQTLPIAASVWSGPRYLK
jgi:DNA polymerase bacteriophage-type